MNEILKKIYLAGMVPAAKISDADNAVPTAKALLRAGLPVIEVTFRTEAAAEAIRRISTECPEILVGAGTVLTRAQVDAALEAGAKFIVAPGFNPDTVKYCVEKGVTMIPGCTSCGEMEQAMALGIEAVKFFPAEALGGTAYLKAVAGPYKGLKFMPTGGVDEKNLMSYLSMSNVCACGGSFMVKESLIAAKKFDEIEKITRNAVRVMLGMTIKHIGINCDGDDECKSVSNTLCDMFCVDPDVHEKAVFAGTLFEVLKSRGRGEKGHIALGTNSPDRARAYLESIGIEFDESTAAYNPDGTLKVVYTKNDVGGFAVHLLKN
ncbi:MAG: bifunctional 4-hydroxy-2-oxoglutarate aldolase/2-dehydro-3-deoxy-phosphogluconate aldolase [Clostridiales bacterium]|nr:bifunctional 4-hydroxy-2-oxoglutarate aldolase/2-dehydro-3-deoxy-phosphogluconate aldolase [Clostridiales bacterium]